MESQRSTFPFRRLLAPLPDHSDIQGHYSYHEDQNPQHYSVVECHLLSFYLFGVQSIEADPEY